MTTTTTELRRLYHLRDVVFPLAAAKHEAGLLDFNRFAGPVEPDSCQTAHCLWGWAVMTPEVRADGFLLDSIGDPCRLDSNGWREPVGFQDIADYYGISYGEVVALFGVERGRDGLQDLSRRLQTLDSLIVEKEGRHA